MKKIISMMLMLLAMSVSMMSCSEDLPTSKIVGTWQQTNSYDTVITITFNANETGYIVYTYPSGNESREIFEYAYDEEDDEIYITGENCQLSGYYDVQITATKLILHGYIDGDYGTYQLTRVS